MAGADRRDGGIHCRAEGRLARGPYSITRHPIYTGILSMMLGSLLLAGGGRWIVPLPVFTVLFAIKIRIEERYMLAEFPDDYPRYRQRVPLLVPGMRLLAKH
jgi:protein-S-isoprenylcysteine O-methyltransferase Ste14